MKLNHSDRTAARNGGLPAPGRWIAAEPGDRARWLQTSEYTPVNVSRILEAANEGDIAELAVAAREIQERNWEVILAMQVRKSALTGLDWGVEPGDERPASKDAALAFEAALKGSAFESGLVSFHELADHLMDAVIAPLSAAEIVWNAGGSLAGFRPVGGRLPVLIYDPAALPAAPESLEALNWTGAPYYHLLTKKANGAITNGWFSGTYESARTAADSPCIDAGAPHSPGLDLEPAPHGQRVNIGAYGGTQWASLTSGAVGLIITIQ